MAGSWVVQLRCTDPCSAVYCRVLSRRRNRDNTTIKRYRDEYNEERRRESTGWRAKILMSLASRAGPIRAPELSITLPQRTSLVRERADVDTTSTVYDRRRHYHSPLHRLYPLLLLPVGRWQEMMMRQQMLRSLRRTQRLAQHSNAARNFSSTTNRKAEVELTVDGQKVSIEGVSRRKTRAINALLIPDCSWLRPHPSLRKGRQNDPPLLLPREAHDCRQLQNVSG